MERDPPRSAARRLSGLFRGPIAGASLRTSAVLVLRLVVQAATLLILANLLGAEVFGGFAGVIALAVLLSALAPFGTHLALLQDLSRDATRRDALLPAALGTTVSCGTALLAVYAAITGGWLVTAPMSWVPLLCIGLAELVLQPLLQLSTIERQARGRIAHAQFLIALPQCLRLLFVIFLWSRDLETPLAAYALGHLLASVAALAWSVIRLDSPWPGLRRWRLIPKRRWREYGGFALVSVSAAGPSEIDKTLALRLLPLTAAGTYAASSRVAGALVIPVLAMMLSALPRLFRASAHVGPPDRRLLKWVFNAASCYGVASALGLWLLGPLLAKLFSGEYEGVGHTISWFALVVPGLCLRFSAASIVMTMGSARVRIATELTGTLSLAVLAWWLTAHVGALGLIVAVAATEWGMACMLWGWIRMRSAHARLLRPEVSDV